jgi:AcrR family transcriptional regulator
MPRRPDPHLRERLIAAATVDFADLGYAGATLDGIAARAGVTKGGVYFHFAGKEELFFAVLDHWRERRRRLLQVPASAASGAEALRALLAGYLGFHFRAPAATHLLRVLATELRGRFTSRVREDARQEQRWLRAQLRELLARGVHDGTLEVEDAALTAFVLAAAVTGVLEQWQTAAADVEPWCHEDQLAATLVARHATGAPAKGAAIDSEFDFGPGRGA